MLVTGASGFLGRHLTRGRATRDWEIVAPPSSSLNVRRRDSTIEAIRDWKPNAVVHLAYRKGDRPTIVDGSRHVAEGAVAAKARLVHVSTDVVFPGRATPYTERDEPRPITDYGRDKYDAERAVAAVAADAVLVRPSLIFGTERLSPAQEALRAWVGATGSRRRAPMTYFTDEYRCPVHADDLAVALAVLAARNDLTGPLHVTGPERVSRAAFAHLLLGHLGASATDLRELPTGPRPPSTSDRPGNIELDVGLAAAHGIRCRPVSAVLG